MRVGPPWGARMLTSWVRTSASVVSAMARDASVMPDHLDGGECASRGEGNYYFGRQPMTGLGGLTSLSYTTMPDS